MLVEVHSAHIGTHLLSLVGEILHMSTSQEVSTPRSQEVRSENLDNLLSLDSYQVL